MSTIIAAQTITIKDRNGGKSLNHAWFWNTSNPLSLSRLAPFQNIKRKKYQVMRRKELFYYVTSASNVMRDMHWCVTVFYQRIENGNIANQIHGFTIDYGKFILIIIIIVHSELNRSFKSRIPRVKSTHQSPSVEQVLLLGKMNTFIPPGTLLSMWILN